jgi:NADH-quinone oxidoreductase subunit E
MSAREETRIYRIEPVLGEEIRGTLREGGANPPGSAGTDEAFGIVSTGEAVEWSAEVAKEVDGIIARYPDRRAALLPVLWIAQREWGFISKEAMEYVAGIIGVPPSEVYSVVSFYTMYKPRPEGRFVFQVCTNISCSLGGGDRIVQHLEKRLGVRLGETTRDGLFTLKSVECLACCEHAPAVQVNATNHYGVTEESMDQLIDRLARADESRG